MSPKKEIIIKLLILSPIFYFITQSIALTTLLLGISSFLYFKEYQRNQLIKSLKGKEYLNCHNHNLPKGYYLYEDDSFYLQGTDSRYQKVQTWLNSVDNNSTLLAKREPENIHDENAIAIYGTINNKKIKLGYLPGEEADNIVFEEMDKDLKLNLMSVKTVPNEENPTYLKILINFEILVKE